MTKTFSKTKIRRVLRHNSSEDLFPSTWLKYKLVLAQVQMRSPLEGGPLLFLTNFRVAVTNLLGNQIPYS